MPKVSIGIPTYNRAKLLKRSIKSALNQNYKNIEVIVSDNASTDETKNICQYYLSKDARFKLFNQSSNIGPTANFESVLEKSSGQYFMWLGDDDWIDETYVSSCLKHLMEDESISLVGGVPTYYRNGHKSHDGKRFDLLHHLWWIRVVSYYWLVEENAIFYGLMRSSQIKKVKMLNVMGGDWHLIANIVSLGKTKVIPEISVHRELGGATATYKQIASQLGLSKIHAIFPMSSTAIGAWMDVMRTGVAYEAHSRLSRLAIASTILIVIMAKSVFVYSCAVTRRIRGHFTK
jgi:glycosyltransferase involved in cell wall biosynthesis